MKQRMFLALIFGAFLLTGISSSSMDITAAEPVKDTITLTVKFPDTVGEGFGVEPTDPAEIHRMILNYGKSHPERTGWSGIAYSCVREEIPYIAGYDSRGNPIHEFRVNSYWRTEGAHSTDDSHVPHSPTRLRDAIIQHYGAEGQELYELALAANAQFFYDPTTPVPSRILNGPTGRFHGTEGRYTIYNKDTTYFGVPCQNGEKAYAYNNNDFFVTATFDVHWKEPEDKKGTGLGRAYWELERTNKDGASEVAVLSEFKGEYDKHVAVRNIKHRVDIGSKRVEQEGPIQFHINAKQVKGRDMSYSFEYEYTNKKIGWVCSGAGEKRRCVWDDNPDWRAVQKFSVGGSIPVDHEQGATEQWDNLDNVLGKKWIVGREDAWNPDKSSKVFHEEWKRAASNNVQSSFNLKTQTHLPILQGAIDYTVELPSGKQLESSFDPLRKEKSVGYYFPMDIDDSLKADYRNATNYSGYDYAFPLQQHIMDDKGARGKKRTFTMDYTTDLFLLTQHTGFLVGVPYADAVKQSMINGSALPDLNSYITQGRAKVQSEFERSTGQKYIDNILHANPPTVNKLQRHYLPVDATSILHPKETYKNHIVYENMGLTDAIFEFDQTFSFNHYLFGSAADDVWLVEQVESRIDFKSLDPSVINKITITNEQLKELVKASKERTDVRIHGFRYSDRDFKDKVNAILDNNE